MKGIKKMTDTLQDRLLEIIRIFVRVRGSIEEQIDNTRALEAADRLADRLDELEAEKEKLLGEVWPFQ